MKKTGIIMLTIAIFMAASASFAQSVAINSDGSAADASAMLDVTSTTKGFLGPRMTEAQRTAISSPATSLLVYQTDGTAGYYYYTGSAWTQIGAASGASQWTTSGSDIYYNSGNVGIGTTSPSSLLQVGSSATSQIDPGIGTYGQFVLRASDQLLSFGLSETSPWASWIQSSNPTSSSTLPLVLNPSGGNVGIGTTSPNYQLSLGSGVGDTKIALWDGSNSDAMGIGIASGELLFHLNSSGDKYTFYDDDEKSNALLTITGGGSVGIGTTSPSTTLDVNGNILADAYQLDGASYFQTQTISGSTEDIVIAFDANDYMCYERENDYLFFNVGGTHRMRISSSGNVGIGTTSPGFPLDVSGSSSDGTSSVYFNGGGSTFQSGSGPFNVSIHASNDIMAGGSIVATSDKRVKENITELHNSLDLIGRLRPVSYNKIDKVEYGDRLNYGFIAQEVEEVIPNAVNTGKGEVPVLKPFEKVEFEDGVIYTILVKNGDDIKEQKYTTADARPEGEIIVKSKTVNDFKSLTYDMIFTVAVGAIQEQQKIIEAQQKQIDELLELVKNLK